MTTQLFPRQTIYGASATLTATGDKLVLDPGRPIVIVEWGFVITTAITGTNGLATLNSRPTAGSTAGQTVGASTSSTGPAGETQFNDTAGGAMTLAPLAAGKAYMHRISLQAAPSGSVSGPTGSSSQQGLTINPGSEAAINVGTGVGTAGAGIPFITYFELPSVGDAVASGSNNPMANVTFAQS